MPNDELRSLWGAISSVAVQCAVVQVVHRAVPGGGGTA